MKSSITISEWQAAMDEVSGMATLPKGAKTTAQIASELGIGATTAKNLVRKLIASGRAERIICKIPSPTGLKVVPHYILKAK